MRLIQKIKQLKFIGLSLLILGACTQGPLSSLMPDMTFHHLDPVTLAVGRIEISTTYQPPMVPPNVEHHFTPPTYVAARQLLEKSLKADGTRKTILRAIVTDASVVEENLPVTEGFWGLLVREPSTRLKARVAVRFELADAAAPDIVRANAEVTADRTKTLYESMSPAQRDQAYYELQEQLMRDVNQGLQTVVKTTFSR